MKPKLDYVTDRLFKPYMVQASNDKKVLSILAMYQIMHDEDGLWCLFKINGEGKDPDLIFEHEDLFKLYRYLLMESIDNHKKFYPQDKKRALKEVNN